MLKAKETYFVEKTYITYQGVSVTIKRNGTAFADYPNDPKIVALLNAKKTGMQRELVSDPERYRVYYSQNSLGSLFTDIEDVMK